MLPEYCGRLYLVFGFDGIFLVDADSHTEAQELYCDYHQCHVTMTEHVMLAPHPEQWGVLWECPPVPEHLCADAGTDNDSCRVCDPPLPYMTIAEVDPHDPGSPRSTWRQTRPPPLRQQNRSRPAGEPNTQRQTDTRPGTAGAVRQPLRARNDTSAGNDQNGQT